MTAPAEMPGLEDIRATRAAIAGHVMRTPLVPSPSLSRVTGGNVFLKLESLQPTGAFKLRGATARLLALSEADRARGVVTMSTGNHGRGLAFAAHRLGVRAVICMSTLVPENKVRAIAEAGAEVRIVGKSQDEAEVEAKRLRDDQGMTMVQPFDDPHVIAGQGTIGLELTEDLPEIDTVLVPLSGGGLIAGIALALEALSPRTRVVGVSMERGAAMYESLHAGHPVAVEEEASLADSLGGGIGLDNAYTFAITRRLVEEVLLVSEEEIARAMAHGYWNDRLIGEGGGVVGQAALLAGKIRRPAGTTVCILSGNNVDMHLFSEIAAAHAPAAEG